jgi:hypothetical protein
VHQVTLTYEDIPPPYSDIEEIPIAPFARPVTSGNLLDRAESSAFILGRTNA